MSKQTKKVAGPKPYFVAELKKLVSAALNHAYSEDPKRTEAVNIIFPLLCGHLNQNKLMEPIQYSNYASIIASPFHTSEGSKATLRQIINAQLAETSPHSFLRTDLCRILLFLGPSSRNATDSKTSLYTSP